MSQTSSREHQQQQQQQRHSQSRTRTRSIGETETAAGANATKKKRTKSTTSTIASSSSRNSSPIPPPRGSSTLSLASSFFDPSLPHHEPVEHALVNNNSDAIEGTSLLGSVWNLFRDVKDLASKEIDKLLEHFPYKNTTKVIVTTNQDDLQDRLLSAKKRQGVLVASLSTTSLPRKSLLGHGPSQKRRAGTPQRSQAVLTKRLLDQDLRKQVNDVSSRRIPASTASVVSGVSTESSRMLSVRSGSASTISETGSRNTTRRKQPLATPRPTPTPPLLKRDSSISASLYRSSQDTEADWSSAVSHLDEVESESGESRTYARSRESSATPPITTMARAMSISGRNQSLQRSRQGEQPVGSDIRKRSISQSSIQPSRHSSSQSESDCVNDAPKSQQQQPRNQRDNGPQTALYPQSSTNSPNRTPAESRVNTKVVDSPPSAFTDSKNNPFIASSGRNSPTQDARTPSPTTNVDNATLSALIEQVSTMREQLASLMAEKQGQYRTHSAPTSVSPGIPPPPPPPPLFPGTPSPKMRTPPVNEATRSMQRVLNELNSSKVHLRKTGSPFLSRISSAIDSSPNSKFSRVVFKSRMDMVSDKYPGSSITGSTAPLSLVNHLRGPSTGTNLEESISQPVEKPPAETPVKRRVQLIYQEPEEEKEEERELSWPSPGTVRRADSRLEMAAKDLSRNKSDKEQAATMSRSSDGLTTRSTDDQTSKKEGRLDSTTPTPKSHHLVETKRKWAPRISQPSETEPREIAQTKSSVIAGAAELSLGRGGSLMDGGGGVFRRERSGPRLDDNNKRPRPPSRPRSMVLSRSMTDPTTLHSAPTMTTAEKEKERQWFMESDMDSWKVAQ